MAKAEAHNPPPRPSRRDPAIMRAAADKLAVECAEWCGQSEPAEWVDDLIRAMRFHSDNAYELARELERSAHVTPDFDLVEILDGADSLIWSAHTEAVKAWVAEVGFTASLEVGQLASCRHGIGPVYAVRAETAEYVIDTDGRGNGGFIIAAEDASPAEQVPA